MNSLLIKRTGFIFIAAVIILAIVYGYMPKPVMVETSEVKHGYMRVTIEDEGKTRVMNRFIISAPVSGYLLRIDLDAGDIVKKGQTIAEIQPLRPRILDQRSRAEAQARVSAAKASLRAAEENAEAAKAKADFAEKELARIRQLFKDDLITKEKLDETETGARSTEAILRASEFNAKVARFEMEAALTALRYSAVTGPGEQPEKVPVKVPVNGNVLGIIRESEGVITEGQPLIEIGDPEALEVVVDVLSADAVKIRTGTHVIFERWGGDEPLQGIVRIVEPAGFTKISALGVEEQRVLVISDITSPREKWTRIGDGYRVEASFVLWENDNVLMVPSSALFRYKEGWAAFALINGKARLRTLKIGHRNGLTAEIISGLSEGDIVITHPDSSIEDGTGVRVRT